MKINIQFPDALDSSWVDSLDDVNTYCSKAGEYLEPIAHQAFRESQPEAWEQIQHILYRYNTNDVERIIDPVSYRGAAERISRNLIIGIQERYYREHHIPLAGGYSPDAAIEILKQEALSHRINRHPLFELMADGLSRDEIRVFLDNYYVNNRLFHLHLATLALSTPLRKRNDLAANFHDEMGCDDPDQAHPVLFLKNYDFTGTPESIDPTPGTLHLLNTKVLLTHLSPDYRKGFGGFGFIEISMPVQMKAILSGLRNSGMSAEQTIFWDLHISIDEVHGESWFDEMRSLLKTEQDYRIILDSGIRLLDARCALYDDILGTIRMMRESHTPEERKAV